MSQTPTTKPPRLSRVGGLLIGATYPLRALILLWQKPQLRGYVLVPILVNLLLGGTVYAGLLWAGLWAIDLLFNNLPHWLPQISSWDPTLPAWFHLPRWNIPLPTGLNPANWHWSIPNWLHFPSGLRLPELHIPLPDWHLPDWHLTLPEWLRPPNWQFQMPDWVGNLPSAGAIALLWLIRTILVLTLLLVTGFIFLQFGVLLGSPWYGKLSEEIERSRTGKVRLVEVGLPREIWRAIAYELKKLVITLGIGLPLLLLHLFPGAGTLASTVGGITLAATIVCMDFFDSTIERRRLNFRAKLGIIARSFPASASFALVCLSLVSIPFINLLAIPLCVAAGTLFVCDRILPWLDPEAQHQKPVERYRDSYPG